MGVLEGKEVLPSTGQMGISRGSEEPRETNEVMGAKGCDALRFWRARQEKDSAPTRQELC
jgi:hypothetical protein